MYHLPKTLVHVMAIPLVDDINCTFYRDFNCTLCRDIDCTLCRTFSFEFRCVALVAHWTFVSRGVPPFVIVCGPIDPRVALLVRLTHSTYRECWQTMDNILCFRRFAYCRSVWSCLLSHCCLCLLTLVSRVMFRMVVA